MPIQKTSLEKDVKILKEFSVRPICATCQHSAISFHVSMHIIELLKKLPTSRPRSGASSWVYCTLREKFVDPYFCCAYYHNPKEES